MYTNPPYCSRLGEEWRSCLHWGVGSLFIHYTEVSHVPLHQCLNYSTILGSQLIHYTRVSILPLHRGIRAGFFFCEGDKNVFGRVQIIYFWLGRSLIFLLFFFATKKSFFGGQNLLWFFWGGR